jgi:hypothetical protein
MKLMTVNLGDEDLRCWGKQRGGTLSTSTRWLYYIYGLDWLLNIRGQVWRDHSVVLTSFLELVGPGLCAKLFSRRECLS